MTQASIQQQASDLLSREARYIDRRLWDDWLELFTPDAIFWMPAWKDEQTLTDDPDREVSMIYYQGRVRLGERVWRARSGLSVASQPLQRTMHTVSNIIVDRHDDEAVHVGANWSCHVYEPRTKAQHVFFGYYDYVLAGTPEGVKIASKKVTLLNDHLPLTVDFYSI